MTEQENLARLRKMTPQQSYSALLVKLIELSLSGEIDVNETDTFSEILCKRLSPQINLLKSVMASYELDVDTALEMQLGLFRGLAHEDEAVFFTKAAAYIISLGYLTE